MDVGQLLRSGRAASGLSRRALARAAGTSAATVAAYEAGVKDPGVATLDRLLAAAGVRAAVRLPRDVPDRAGREAELVEVLDLAARFPTRPQRTLRYPPFAGQLRP